MNDRLDSLLSLDVVIPVYNEEIDLQPSISYLREFLEINCPYRWHIIIADNASVDQTPQIGRKIADQHATIRYLRLPEKGRGRALRRAWSESSADVCCYMDVDLSTDLNHLMPLVEPLLQGSMHIATGSRLLHGSVVVGRTLLREFTSRAYNLLIGLMFPGRKFLDAQCGFKAITRQASQKLLPLVKDNAWFFDTELLLRATMAGYRIHQVPVRWEDDPGSTVNIIDTAWKDIKGLIRVRFGG